MEEQSEVHGLIGRDQQPTNVLYYRYFSQIVGPGCERDLNRELRRMGQVYRPNGGVGFT